MHLSFTDRELATLMEMVTLATEIAHVHPDAEIKPDFSRYEAIENKVLDAAGHTSLATAVEYDAERGRNRVTEDFAEGSYFQSCLEEFRNAIFWEELMLRLAERQLVGRIGLTKVTAMNDEDRRKKLEPIEKSYLKKFQEQGLDSLHWIERNEDTGELKK